MIALTLHGTTEETAHTLLLLGTVLDVHGVYGPDKSHYAKNCVALRITATPVPLPDSLAQAALGTGETS